MSPFKIDLVEFDAIFLVHSWNWLQDEEIRQMISAEPVSKQEQLIWFNRIKLREDYLIWGVNANHIPIGATGLKNITASDCEYWGYLGNKLYWGKGVGTQIMQIMEEKAISMNLDSIWLKVNQDNLRAVNLYKKMHYVFEKQDDGLIILRKFL